MAVLRRRVVLAAGIGTTLSVPRVNAQADWPKGSIKFIKVQGCRKRRMYLGG